MSHGVLVHAPVHSMSLFTGTGEGTPELVGNSSVVRVSQCL